MMHEWATRTTSSQQPIVGAPIHEGPPAAKKAKTGNGGDAAQKNPSGMYTRNRKGMPLCPGYNSGACTNTVRGAWCGEKPEHMHLCEKCLGNYRASECNHDGKPDTYVNKRKGTGGKGKGKGKY